MDAKINVITLGVAEIKRAKQFYEGLGFVASSMSNEHFVAFQMANIVFCLYPEKLLAEDVTVEASRSGFRGVTLAYNVVSKEDVQPILERAEKCGAKIIKPAQDVFWGGFSGYFADPDGHLWEVAWNPHWPLGKDGMIRLPQ